MLLKLCASTSNGARAPPPPPHPPPPQVGCTEVMDALTGNSSIPMLLIDVRSQEEVEVSTIPGAVHCPAFEQAGLTLGW